MNTRTSFACCIIGMLGLLGAAPATVRAENPKVVPVTVPFELLGSKHMAVKVKINGKGPYRLIFDTGAPFILVNLKTARDSGMVARDKKPGLFSMFNSLGAIKMQSFDLGGAKIENTSAAVMDHPTVELIGKVMGPIEGLVGYPFFARYKLSIDYQAKKMILTPNGFKVSDADGDPESLSRAMLSGEASKRVLAPAGQWGFLPHKEADDDAAGVTVKYVFAGSAAAKAGLKEGDRVLTIDGRWTDSTADAFFAARQIKPNTTVKMVIQRDGKEMTLTITPRAGL